MKAHHIADRQLESEYGTDITSGLTFDRVKIMQEKYGKNIVPEGKRDSLIVIFLRQFKNPLLYILLLSATIIFFLGEYKDAFIISGVLLFNAIVGTIQEGRAHSILSSLKKFIRATCIVIRENKRLVVDVQEVVPGDIIVLNEGDQVPADARLVTAAQLRVNESLLTGESTPVDKHLGPLPADTPLFEQKNMIFKGTFVVSGSARAVVVATGSATQLGMMQRSIELHETDMPLKQELDALSHKILLLIIVICMFLLIVGLWMGKSATDLLVMLTALFICVIPEGLPVVFTLVLVTGAFRLAQQKVLVKRLQAVEGLGRTEVIIMDKTGTLTRNEMMVTKAVIGQQEYTVSGQGYYPTGNVTTNHTLLQDSQPAAAKLLGAACVLLNNAAVHEDKETGAFVVEGDPLEAALGVFARKIEITRANAEAEYHLLYEMPFDRSSQMHVGFYKHDNDLVVFAVGAPEKLLQMSKETSLHQPLFTKLLDEGLRVVAVSYYRCPYKAIAEWSAFLPSAVFGNFSLLALLGMQDAIRHNVQPMIEQARASGLSLIMATGDHKKTALYVGTQTGIFRSGDRVIEGHQIAKMTDPELAQALEHTTIFARVVPADKVRVIKILQDQHKLVAMTGDGINDVPALVAANLGVAMGGAGTDIAQDAADIVLLDDSFGTIINAIEEGRHIFYTLRRVVLYFFATNFGEILVVLFALVLNLPLPILAAQILWLNLITDGFLDMALAMEMREPHLLSKQWLQHVQRTGLIDRNLLLKIMYMALPMGIGSLFLFYHYYESDLTKARTMTLVCMAMFQWFNAWNCRSETLSSFYKFWSNRWLIVATLLVLALQIMILYVPFFQNIFRTVPLSLAEWIIIFCISSSVLVVEEIRKWTMRRWYKAV